ncbi:PLP-dependent aminotransferase family protein [Anoxynatronum sibiricum]|uniref:PLP-dependent aminotransferase family protein n=1 Tax=Anoxynatronum sibiricum TaxID=210623 RepID=A0ABU9VNX6_9CLOT
MAGYSTSTRVVELSWKPDKESKIPAYRQIIDYMSTKISKGDWTIGSVLPSQRAMARIFGVNRSTVVMALQELESFGIIKGEVGKGTQVISNTWSLLMSASTPDWSQYLRSGLFKENIPTIRMINKMEFEEGILRLGTGELSPRLYPDQMMEKVFSRLPHAISSLNYVEPLGLLELREVICEKLKQKGIHCKPTNVLITSGSLQALQLISVSMLHQGSSIFTEAPSYIKSLQVFQSAGMRLLGVPMDREGIQYWKIASERTGREEALLYTIPTFHNPTGYVMSPRRRKELFNFCTDTRLPIIEDDAYGDLWIDEAPPLPLKSMDKNGMILYVGTISKSLFPGLRVGWMVGSESVVDRLGDVKMQMDYGASSVSQWILKEILSSDVYDRYMNTTRSALKKRRDTMLTALETYFRELADWETPKGGFYIWLTLRNHISVDKLFRQALQEKILLNPGSIYDFKRSNTLRLSYAYVDEDKMMVSVGRLAAIVATCSIE